MKLEFTTLSIERIAATLQQALGGEIPPHSAYEYTVSNTGMGDFAIELGYAFLKVRYGDACLESMVARRIDFCLACSL